MTHARTHSGHATAARRVVRRIREEPLMATKVERLTVAAKDWADVTEKAQAAHPEVEWSINITESTDPAAIAGASARGLTAYTVERKRVNR
jgi:hypothetical protein